MDRTDITKQDLQSIASRTWLISCLHLPDTSPAEALPTAGDLERLTKDQQTDGTMKLETFTAKS